MRNKSINPKEKSARLVLRKILRGGFPTVLDKDVHAEMLRAMRKALRG